MRQWFLDVRRLPGEPCPMPSKRERGVPIALAHARGDIGHVFDIGHVLNKLRL